MVGIKVLPKSYLSRLNPQVSVETACYQTGITHFQRKAIKNVHRNAVV